MKIECRNLLENGLADNSVDLIVCSPPYNLDIPYDNYKDKKPYPQYLADDVEKWLTEFKRVLKPDGRCCINVSRRITIDGVNLPLESDYIQILLKVGLKFRASIVWYKGNTSKAKFGTYGKAKAPNVRDNTECVIVGFKEVWKKQSEGQSDMVKREFDKFSVDLWNMSTAKKSIVGHPAPFPEELPLRCIKLFSFVGDLVWDPFSGSGTTALVAEKLGRRFIGTDISEKYVSDSCDKMKEQIGDVWHTFDLV